MLCCAGAEWTPANLPHSCLPPSHLISISVPPHQQQLTATTTALHSALCTHCESSATQPAVCVPARPPPERWRRARFPLLAPPLVAMSDKGKSSTSSSTSSSTAKPKEGKEEEKKKTGDDDDDIDPSLTRAWNTSVSTPPLHLVIVHPLVLLSVVDHYNRVAKDTSKRVVGVLLGEAHAGKVDVTNSYAVPFEEDAKDASSWYIDRQYHDDMYGMFKKVNASEKVIGWYSTGPKLRATDISIHELFRAYTPHPILVIIDVNPQHDPLEIPTLTYISIESSPEAQRASRRQFAHLPSEIGAYEAEEVGVEHLLRNLRDTTDSSLGEQVNAKLTSLKGLSNRLHDIYDYLGKVEQGKLPPSHAIIALVQDMMNLLPNVEEERLKAGISVSANDNAMAIYVGSLVRSILALHDLIVNKINNQRVERGDKGGKEKDKEEADKAKAKGKEGKEGAKDGQKESAAKEGDKAREKDEEKKKEAEEQKK